MENKQIKIKTEYIKLDQLLKFADVCMSGGEAKDMIFSEMIEVNGEVCTQRGKKIRVGDEITVLFDDETVVISVS